MNENVLTFFNIALESIKKAEQFEKDGKNEDCLSWYLEGLDILVATKKLQNCNTTQVADITKHILQYMKQAELVKCKLDKENGLDAIKICPSQHQQIKIEKDSTGHGYQTIFGRFLVQGDVTEVVVEDPYIREPHQISNFVCFCEMLLKSRSRVKKVILVTGLDKQNSQVQQDSLEYVRNNLRHHDVQLTVKYSEKLHDREIRFSNGWIVKIGRGLDYIKRLPNDLMIGAHEYDFRQCLETTIDIFHHSSVVSDSSGDTR